MQKPSHTRTEVRERYEEDNDPPTDGYANCGDANPGPHGGVWVTYDGGEWDVLETVMAANIGFPDAGEEDIGDQYVTAGNVQWRDLVTEDGEWTDRAARFVDTFYHSHDTPMGAVVDHSMTAYAAWYVTDYGASPYPRRKDGRHQKDDYEAVLDAIGVEPIDE